MTGRYDPAEWDSDPDGNPEWVGPPKEEPDCPGCNDQRYVPRRGLGRRLRRWLGLGGGYRPCPSCNPTRRDVAAARWRAARRRLAWPRPRRVYTDEPPF